MKNLPTNQLERIESIKNQIKTATSQFKRIEASVFLDDDSDGSHLPTWYNAISAFQKEIGQ